MCNGRLKRAERDDLVSKFSSGHTRILVATDAALSALGEDLCMHVAHVISFDFPNSMAQV